MRSSTTLIQSHSVPCVRVRNHKGVDSMQQTQERAAELYEEHKNIVEGIAVNFAHKYQKDVDEALSRANLIFMQVFSKHDDKKGDFRIRLLHLLPRRLVGTLRISDSVIRYDTRYVPDDEPPPFFFLSCDIESSRDQYGHRENCRHDNRTAPGLQFVQDENEEEAPAFDYDSLSSVVGKDAALVLSEIEHISGDVALEVGDTNNNRRALYKFRRYVRTRFGWSRERVVRAFNELSGLKVCRA